MLPIFNFKNLNWISRHVLLYGLLLASLVFLLKWMQWKFLIAGGLMQLYIGLIAAVFTILGVWLATRLIRPGVQRVIVDREMVPRPEEAGINESELEKLDLSKREHQVLQLVAKGHSNAEVARELFLSVSTVKTHVSRLLMKLEAKSRTHAVTKARKAGIV